MKGKAETMVVGDNYRDHKLVPTQKESVILSSCGQYRVLTAFRINEPFVTTKDTMNITRLRLDQQEEQANHVANEINTGPYYVKDKV